MKRVTPMLLTVALCIASSACLGPSWKTGTFARVPESTLLTGWAPSSLYITTPTGAVLLQESAGSSSVIPSMSKDGTIIASGRMTRCCDPRMVMIQTYSTNDKTWTDHKEIESGGSLAISPDGTRLAYPAFSKGSGGVMRIHVMDLTTRTESLSPPINGIVGYLTWSPDGNRIAYDVEPDARCAVHILDIATGQITIIPDAQTPAWSPSGDWIAFFYYDENLWIVRPDGRDRKFLIKAPKRHLIPFGTSQRSFGFGPVWSPDSKTLLLNERAMTEAFLFNVHVLDISKPKLIQKAKLVPPVYAWSSAPPAH